jgi:hypothetical protein
MKTSNLITYVRRSARRAILAMWMLVGLGLVTAEARQSPTETPSASVGASWTRLGHIDHALALSDTQARNTLPPWRAAASARTHRRWPVRANPRRWPRLFATTTECTVSFDPVLRRHWWQ